MRLTTTATALALAGALGLIQPSPAEAQHRDTRQEHGRSYRPTSSRRDQRGWRQAPRHRERDRRPAPRYDSRYRYSPRYRHSPRYRPVYRGHTYAPHRYYGHRRYVPCRPGYRCYYPAPYDYVPSDYYLDGVAGAGFGLRLSGPRGGVRLGGPGFGVYFNW